MKLIFDASAVLAAIFMESGADKTTQLWSAGEGYISAVNYAEVVTKLNERGMPDTEIDLVMDAIPLTVIDFDVQAAIATGLMRKSTKALGLSLGDRACLALAQLEQAQIVTAERLWKSLKGFEIELVR